jgi:hypothetical protein
MKMLLMRNSDASYRIALEEIEQETKPKLTSRHQNSGQNHNTVTANRACENAAEFKQFGTTVIVQNLVQEEIIIRLIRGDSCYHSVQNLLPPCLKQQQQHTNCYR